MIDFAVNIEPLYPGLDICEKIQKVSASGFDAVEFWGWEDRDLEQIRETCQKCGVKVRAICGTGNASLCDREHGEEVIDWVKRSITAAKKLDCDTLILFPNHFTPNGCADFRGKYSHEAMIANITYTLARLVPILEEEQMTILFEPLHNLGADAGMSVTDTEVGGAIVRAIGSEHIRLLCDVFHMQVMHGNLVPNILNNLDIVPYLHIADSPDRHEPGTGEINFEYLCRKIKESGFCGTVCMEYFPEGDTEAGFPAVKAMLDLLK